MSIASAIPIDDFFSVNATPSSPGGVGKDMNEGALQEETKQTHGQRIFTYSVLAMVVVYCIVLATMFQVSAHTMELSGPGFQHQA